MLPTVTLIQLLEYIVYAKDKSVEEAITFCNELFYDYKNEMKQFEKGYADQLEEKGVRESDEYYLAGYRLAVTMEKQNEHISN